MTRAARHIGQRRSLSEQPPAVSHEVAVSHDLGSTDLFGNHEALFELHDLTGVWLSVDILGDQIRFGDHALIERRRVDPRAGAQRRLVSILVGPDHRLGLVHILQVLVENLCLRKGQYQKRRFQIRSLPQFLVALALKRILAGHQHFQNPFQSPLFRLAPGWVASQRRAT